ncbi:hypothetical protein D9M68_601900 [compost metagenome]
MLAFKNNLNMTKGIFPNQITKIVSPREFLYLIRNRKDSIVRTRVILPQIGKPGFAKFKITYKSSI